MTEKQLEEVIEALFQFVIRASKEGAKPEEIAVLPSVAGVLLGFKKTIITLGSHE